MTLLVRPPLPAYLKDGNDRLGTLRPLLPFDVGKTDSKVGSGLGPPLLRRPLVLGLVDGLAVGVIVGLVVGLVGVDGLGAKDGGIEVVRESRSAELAAIRGKLDVDRSGIRGANAPLARPALPTARVRRVNVVKDGLRRGLGLIGVGGNVGVVGVRELAVAGVGVPGVVLLTVLLVSGLNVRALLMVSGVEEVELARGRNIGGIIGIVGGAPTGAVGMSIGEAIVDAKTLRLVPPSVLKELLLSGAMAGIAGGIGVVGIAVEGVVNSGVTTRALLVVELLEVGVMDGVVVVTVLLEGLLMKLVMCVHDLSWASNRV